MNLHFDAAEHVYRIDGDLVPSVTQVLDDNRLLPDYSRLDPYYRVRGTKVHHAMALEVEGRLDWSSLDEHTLPFVERGARLIEELDIEPLVVEFRYADPVHGYAGTLDLFANSALGPVLIDWKAGQHEDAHMLQVAGGYWPLLDLAAQDGAVDVDVDIVRRCRCGVVSLKGELPKPRWVEDRCAARADFRAALRMTQWRQHHNVRRAA